MLAKPRWISVNPRRMQLFRLSFLAFTLIFIGWYAQGQLSIVQLTGAVKTLAAGQGPAVSFTIRFPCCSLPSR